MVPRLPVWATRKTVMPQTKLEKERGEAVRGGAIGSSVQDTISLRYLGEVHVGRDVE